MDDPMAIHQAEVKRIRDTYGPNAEIPHPPIAYEVEKLAGAEQGRRYTGETMSPMSGRLQAVNTYAGAPINRPPVAVRIEDLASQAALAGRELAEAREEYQRAALVREQATKRFISVTEALFQAIQEHREGTPEGVPYPS